MARQVLPRPHSRITTRVQTISPRAPLQLTESAFEFPPGAQWLNSCLPTDGTVADELLGPARRFNHELKRSMRGKLSHAIYSLNSRADDKEVRDLISREQHGNRLSRSMLEIRERWRRHLAWDEDAWEDLQPPAAAEPGSCWISAARASPWYAFEREVRAKRRRKQGDPDAVKAVRAEVMKRWKEVNIWSYSWEEGRPGWAWNYQSMPPLYDKPPTIDIYDQAEIKELDKIIRSKDWQDHADELVIRIRALIQLPADLVGARMDI